MTTRPDSDLLHFTPSDDSTQATVRVRAGERSSLRVSRYLTGKFCEHLGNNINQGMHAQILKNPTFGDFPFASGNRPDGGRAFISDEAAIAEQIRGRAKRLNWPEPERLVESRQAALAHWWIKEGDAVRTSPDVARHGGRAQRVEVTAPGGGIAQWTYLPLHRVRELTWQITMRAPELTGLTLSLFAGDAAAPTVTTRVEKISTAWQTFSGTLQVAAETAADLLFRLAITSPETGQFVVASITLFPVDHVNGADPEIIQYLRESQLPLLRWPGGNFVSGYRWEDGIGPIAERPTRPNPAWGGLEPNFFGTDEFIAFCREVGCEPLICINAGDGTPDEAARWIEYCNGAVDTPMGARRAANGHPEPYDIYFWEIGNELHGSHQVGWTTPAGYADRYRVFSDAMLGADPSVRLIACAGSVHCTSNGEEWNQALVAENADSLKALSDHILVGGQLTPTTNPLDVYRDFMAYPTIYEKTYVAWREALQAAGITDPRLAITELQLFGRVKAATEDSSDGSPRLTRETLVNPTTMAEAVYNVLFYHLAVRLTPFIDIITHSATVNHGGGLRKERERVYANPCHYAQAMFAVFAESEPLPVELSCVVEARPGVLYADRLPGIEVPLIDPVAARAADGSLLISLVHRGVNEPRTVNLVLDDVPRLAGAAELHLLSAPTPWAANTIAQPDYIRPSVSKIACADGKVTLDLPAYCVAVLRFPLIKAAAPVDQA